MNHTTLSVKTQLPARTFRLLNRLCGPRTGRTRADWVAEAIAEKVERETGSAASAVVRGTTHREGTGA